MSELVTPRRAVARAAKRNGVASLSLRDSARLPRVSPAMLRAANIVFSREEPLAFRVQDADYEFRWLPRQRLFGADSVLRLRVGKVPAWLALENVGVFERLRGLVQAQLPVQVQVQLALMALQRGERSVLQVPVQGLQILVQRDWWPRA